MTIDIATLGIKVDSADTTKAATELDKLKKSGDKAGASIKTLEKESKLLGVGMSALGGVISGLSFAAFATSLMRTNIEMERLRSTLKTITGSQQGSEKAFKFLQDFAKNTPYEIDGLTKTFITLKTLGIEPTTKVMESFTRQASALGASQETLTAIATQLGQAYSRNKLQGEDLIVLLQKGVPVYDILAEKLGVHRDKIIEMAQAGQLGRDAMDKLIEGMGTFNGNAEANKNAMDTLAGSLSNLGDAWHTFEDTLLNDKSAGLIKGIVDFISGQINALTKDIEDLSAAYAYFGRVYDSFLSKRDQFSKNQEQLPSENGRASGYAGRYGDMGGRKRNKQNTKELAAAEAEIEKESLDKRKKAINDAWQMIDEIDEKFTKKSFSRSAARNASKKSETASIKSAAQIEAEALQANYQRMVEALARESALKGDNSRLAALEYDLEAGALSKLTEAQKLYLLQTTSEIENARINAKIAEDKKTEMDQLIDKYNQLTLSAREYYQLLLTNKGIAPDQQGDLLAQYDKNAGIERANAEVDAGIAKLESYTSSINETSNAWADMGESASEAMDRTLGGINKVIGITKNYIKQISDISKKQMENETRAKNIEYLYPGPKRTKEIENYYKIKDELDAESMAASMTAIRQVTQAQANMYEEGTAAANVAKVANLAAIAAEFAAQWQLLTVRAAAAIANQGGGDVYTAFARIAAMMALMGSVISQAGGSSSFSGISGTPPTGTKTTGTTLGGGKDDQSESATNIADLLKDIHGEEYIELRGINKGVAALSDAITGAITGIFRFGGLKDFKVSGLGTVTTVKSLIPTITSNMVNQLLFGKTKTSIVGGGIEAAATQMQDILEGAMMDMRQYLTIETKKSGGLFGKKSVKYSTKYGPLDDDISMGITRIFESAGGVMIDAANALGDGLAERVRDYVIPSFQIELRGLNAEDAVKKVNDMVSALLDQMSEAVFGDIIGEYQKLGEGMLETAIRIVAQMAVVRDALNESGLSMANNAIYISDALIEAAGSIEEFQQQFSDFYDAFYTAGEQQDRLAQKLGDQLSEVWGPTAIAYLAQSREAYRGLLEQVNLDTELGRERYSMMLRLADSADEYYSAIEDGEAAKAELAAQQRSLDIELMSAQGKTSQALAESRKDELAAMDASLRATKQAIWAATEMTAARNAEREAAQEAAQAALEFNNKKRALEIQLMEAQGKAQEALTAKRQDELKALDKRLQPLQSQIYAAQDAGKAQSGIGGTLKEFMVKIAGEMTTSIASFVKNGQFQAGEFNLAYAFERLERQMILANDISKKAMNVQDAGGIMDELTTLPEFLVEAIDYGYQKLIRGDTTRQGGVALSNLASSLANFAKAQLTRTDAPGIASVRQAYMDEFQRSQAPGRAKLFANALEEIEIELKNGKMTAEQYAYTQKVLTDQMSNLSVSYTKDLSGIAKAGVDSINYYFDQISDATDKMAQAAKEAAKPIALATAAIGRLISIAQVFAESAVAARQGGGNAGIADKAGLIAAAATIASRVMTTADAKRIAEQIATQPAFANLTASGIRDASLLLDGLSQFDPASFEAAFTRLNNALAKGNITEAQYSVLFSAAIDTYEGTAQALDTLKDAARSLADQLLLNANLTSLTGNQTVTEAKRQYQEALAKAQAGDLTDLQSVTGTMLEIVKNNSTNEVDYNRIFGQTIGDIRALETPVQDKQQAMLDELRALREEVSGLRADARLSSAVIAGNTAKTVKRLDEFNINGMPTVALT